MRMIKCKVCNQIKEHHGHEMCKICYYKQYNENHHRIKRPSKSLYSETTDSAHITIRCKMKNDGETFGIYTDFSTITPLASKSLYSNNTDGGQIDISCTINKKTNHITISTGFLKKSDGGFRNNKACASYLGDIAEQLLSHIYPNVERMSYNNPGYDLICGRGYKVDVKSSCLGKGRQKNWSFHISKNIIADYFLCLGFDNRDDLNPEHIWLIPGHVINHLMAATISVSTIEKWSEYEQSLDKVLECCNTMKGDK